MHEIYDCDKRVYVPTIYEPVRKTDRVFVLRDGVIYEWDNTVTEQIAEDDLRHFTATNLVLTENKVSVDDILSEIAEGVKYKSDKTESFLFRTMMGHAKFRNVIVPELDSSSFGLDDLKAMASALISLYERNELDPELKGLVDECGKSVPDLQANLWVSRKDKHTNKLLTAWFAISKLCEQLKADMEARQATKPAVPPVAPAPAEADNS